MNLKQLEYFVSVAELGSFSKAALVLNIAQPALSRQVRLLETDLHVTLPADEVAYLDALVREKGSTRNALVCEAVTAYRTGLRKAEIEAAMRRDVETLVEENAKLLREIEPHAMEVLLRETEW